MCMEVPDIFYQDLVGIGVQLTNVRVNRQADIERTLIEASSYVDSSDRRILGLLASWIVTHGSIVCVGRLKRLLDHEKHGDSQVVAALAFLAVEKGLHEWKSLCRTFPEKYLWGKEGTKRMLKFQKPVESFAHAGLFLPERALRIRESDIMPLRELARAHLQVRLRLLFGANIRADAAFYISKGVRSPSELMRAIGCSYEPAHRIFNDFVSAGGLKLPEIPLPKQV